jgi:hypothetical protein
MLAPHYRSLRAVRLILTIGKAKFMQETAFDHLSITPPHESEPNLKPSVTCRRLLSLLDGAPWQGLKNVFIGCPLTKSKTLLLNAPGPFDRPIQLRNRGLS